MRTGLFAVWACMVAARVLGLAARYINHDAAWFLYMARVTLDGGRLYRDVVDTNPPLIVWLSTPPALVGRVLGVSDSVPFLVYVAAMVALSFVVCARLVPRVWPDLPAHLRLTLLTLILFLLFVSVHREFGQREHFTALVALPYVLATMAWVDRRALSRHWGLAVGVAAGIGLALKPHLLAPAVLVEGYLAVAARDRRPWRRPEAVALAAAVLGYAIILIGLVPEYLDVATRVAQVYGGLNPPAIQLLRVPEVPIWALAALMLWLIRMPDQQRPMWVVFFLAGTGFLIAGLSQLKGWGYHLYPARVVLVTLLGAQVVWLLHALGSVPAIIRGGTRTIGMLVALTLLVGTVRQTFADRRPDTHDLTTPLKAHVARDAHGGPIFVMGMLLYPAFPLVTIASVSWSSRYNSFWFLPGLYREALATPGDFRLNTPSEMPSLERAFYDEVIDDLCARPPTLLVVESVTHYAAGVRRPFDLLGYYRQDPRFARLLSSYEPVDRVGAFDVLLPRQRPGCEEVR